ncbi:MAG: malonate decarboxylase subunit epsilon [Negativicutes bacterium]|nr:malonate decarboxylase subunit epsilon [Negativicutes bacterium]
MTISYLFPGQGSQRPGMLHQLPSHHEVARTIEEASEVLGRNVLELDAEDTIRSTVSTQIAIYTAGVAVTRALAAEGAFPDAVAGLSIGAYAAATACGALSFRDGVRLVHLRASMMEEAFPSGFGLTAIVGLDEEQVNSIVSAATTPDAPVFVGNLNALRQIVVAGSDAGMERVIDLAQKAGCQKAERLEVSVPSHCKLLAGVADRLVATMKDLEPRPITAQYLTNRRARPTHAFDRIREDIATNIAYSVRWHDITEVLVGMGTELFVEITPGRVLSKLTTEAFPEVPAIAVSAMPLEAVIRQVKDVRASAY